MAGLLMKTLAEEAMAAPVGRQPHHLVVSVTDVQGRPVTGLAGCDFTVGPLIVGPPGNPVEVAGVAPGRSPGSYLISLASCGARAWQKGIYLFTIAASSGSDSGQTLAAVLMD